MRSLVFLLEEPSAKDLLQGLLPRLLPPELPVKYLVFEGKQDLENQLVRKLRTWLDPEASFVVLRDQDSAPCEMVKQRLLNLVKQSGRTNVLVRVACRELESWVVGDWEAISQAFEKPKLKSQGNKAKFRDPDQLYKPVEEIRRFIPDYQKRAGARAMGLLLRADRNRSRSFRVFCKGVTRLVDG